MLTEYTLQCNSCTIVAQNGARGCGDRHYEAKMVDLQPSSAEQLKMPIHDIDEYDFVWCAHMRFGEGSDLPALY